VPEQPLRMPALAARCVKRLFHHHPANALFHWHAGEGDSQISSPTKHRNKHQSTSVKTLIAIGNSYDAFRFSFLGAEKLRTLLSSWVKAQGWTTTSVQMDDRNPASKGAEIGNAQH